MADVLACECPSFPVRKIYLLIPTHRANNKSLANKHERKEEK
jgi:hypothetical protein